MKKKENERRDDADDDYERTGSCATMQAEKQKGEDDVSESDIHVIQCKNPDAVQTLDLGRSVQNQTYRRER